MTKLSRTITTENRRSTPWPCPVCKAAAGCRDCQTCGQTVHVYREDREYCICGQGPVKA